MRDTFYVEQTDLIEAFRFDSAVVPVFDDMIRLSVPGYAFTLSLINVVAEYYFQQHTRCYDLGCSTGASLMACWQAALKKNVHLVGVDNSQPMIDCCKNNLAAIDALSFELRCEGLESTLVQDASMVILNFTLQFLSLAKRPRVLKRIAEGLHSGGVLVLSEKITHSNGVDESILQSLHHRFKSANGYSDLEISRKRSALEGVLISQTVAEHTDALKEAGFSKVLLLHQAFNFVTLLAIKS